MTGLGPLLLAAAAFIATHLLLSHPLRAPLVAHLGARGFLGLYSVVALATFVWLIVAYRHVPPGTPLWAPTATRWALVSLLMLLASVLLVGSFVRNPASPGVSGPVPERATGVYAVTRHPMMWAFALWAACHVVVYPEPAAIDLASASGGLALCGAALQDRKKERLEPERWQAWERKTSFWPFAAIATGRARLGGFGIAVPLVGLILWLAATWAHPAHGGWQAGIWLWLL